ncbi:MAG TPA: hypothetical protein VHZ03_03255 [Trebonia sp.]|nr:hypothetical protein [Trebonia sp.]
MNADFSNPFNSDLTPLVTPDLSSAAQEIAKVTPAGAHVVEAFSTVFGKLLPRTRAKAPARRTCSSPETTPRLRARVSSFVERLSLRSPGVGDLEAARWLEGASMLPMRAMPGKAIDSSNFPIGLSVRGRPRTRIR